MQNNTYRMIIGVIFLVSLYFDVELVIYPVIAIVLLEGITNYRIPKIVNRFRKIPEATPNAKVYTRFNFEAERAFRLMLSTVMLVTYPLGPDSVMWFFPWFMSLTILGAGASGICPGLALIKWLGFR